MFAAKCVFVDKRLKNSFSVPGEWIQLCEHRSRQRGRPPQDVFKHCGIDCHPRPASVVVSLGLQQGGLEGVFRQTDSECASDADIFLRRGDLISCRDYL